MARENKRMAGYEVVKIVLASTAVAMLSLIPTGAFAQSKASKKAVDSVGSVITEVTRIREEVHGAIGSLGALTSGDQAKLRKHYNAGRSIAPNLRARRRARRSNRSWVIFRTSRRCSRSI